VTSSPTMKSHQKARNDRIAVTIEFIAAPPSR
jgi:hypothetical protein